MTDIDITPDANEIIPNLWVGNYRSGLSKSFIKKYNISRIINITKNIPNRLENITYLNLPVEDEDMCLQNLTKYFNKCSDFIWDSLKNNKNVLVFSYNGENRAPVIVAAFLIKYLKQHYYHSIMYIKSLRKKSFAKETSMTKALFEYYLGLHNLNIT